MNKHLTLIAIFIFAMSTSLISQKLLKPFETVSHKKTSYIVKEDGTEIQGQVKKLKRKKGLIKEINIKGEDGKKVTIPIEDIKYAYLPQSGWDKLMKADDFLTDATQWEDGLYDNARLKEGYALFEKAEVIVKKKKRVLLMQLLNPHGCDRVKVYHNPFATETSGLGIGGIQVTGGKDKSYYISVEDATSFKLGKKKYKKMFDEVFADCEAVKKEFGKKGWNKFEKALFAYNKTCKK